MTKRAKKRLLILLAAIGFLVVALVIARSFQQSSRDARALRLKTTGLEAIARGDYAEALSDLSYTLIRYPDDIEALLGFAEARSLIPQEGGRHLARALATYNLALNQIRSNEEPKETLILALEGRARIERALGQLARLELTSMELVAIDPKNKQAIENMLAVSLSLGRLLPGDADLLVRGESTNAQWTQRMRDAESVSALRWAMELVDAEGLSLDLMLAIASILGSEEAIALQQMQLGGVRERVIELLDRWATEEPRVQAAAGVVAAREALIRGRPDECRRRLENIDLVSSDDPSLILLAISIFESMRTNADREAANQLLAKLREMTGLGTETQMLLATRYWVLERPEECLDVLKSGTLLESDTAKLKIDANLLWILASPDETAERVEDLRKIAEDPKSDVLARDRSAVIVGLSDRLKADDLDAIEFERQITSLDKWIGDPLLLCVLGDLAEAGRLRATAVNCYEAAQDSFVGSAAPIDIRLIASLSASGDRVSAFEEARKYAGRSNSLQSAVVLLRAWIAIEELGRDISDVAPQFVASGDPLDFLENIQGELERLGEVPELMLPLRCRALLLRGDRAAAESELGIALASGISDSTSATLLRIAKINQLKIDSAVIASMLESDLGPETRVALVDFEADRLLSDEGFESAVRFLDLQVATSASEFADKKKNLLGFLNSEVTGVDRDDALGALLGSELNRVEIQEIVNNVIARNDIQGSGRIFGYLVGRFGEASPEVASVDGRLTLAFDSGSESSILEAIARIDKLVAAGVADAGLELVLARLWMAEPVRNPNEAIEALLAGMERRTDTVPNLLLLTQLLQEVGRPSEAAPLIQRLKRLESQLTPPQLALFANLLGIQGDVDAMRDSVCSLAAASGRTADVIGCIRLCLELGDIATADQLLDELAARPDRDLAIDRALASRHVRNGEIEKAIEQLKSSGSFEREEDRQTSIATIQMNNGDWAMAVQSLNNLGPDLMNSGEAQLLLAICLLKGPERDVSAARAALDRVLVLNAGQAGFLRRAASISIEDVELNMDSDRYIAALREVEPEQAEVLQIRTDLLRENESLDNVLGLVPRAEAVRNSLFRAQVAWQLYIEVLTRGFILARSAGDLYEARRLAGLLDEAAVEYRRSFPGDYGVVSRAGRIKLLLGDAESAALIARAAMEEIRGEVSLIDTVLIAESQYRMKNYLMSRRLLEPYAATISRAPRSWPRCWEMLYRSRLYTGDVDAALAMYLSRFSSRSEDVNWRFWFDALALASPEIAIAAVAMVPGAEEVPVLQFQAVNALSRLFSSSGDPAVLAELRRRVDAFEDLPSDPLTQFRAGAARVEASASIDVNLGREEAVAWIDSLPSDLLASISNLSGLSAERRAEIDPFVFLVVLSLNNALARSGEDAARWQDGSDGGVRIDEFLKRADRVLEEISLENGEILDSRALYYLAVGDASKALSLASAAADMAAGNPAILLTLAKAHLVSGQRQEAIEVGERAQGLLQLSETQDSDLVRRIEEFLEVAESGEETYETGMDWKEQTTRVSWQKAASFEAMR